MVCVRPRLMSHPDVCDGTSGVTGGTGEHNSTWSPSPDTLGIGVDNTPLSQATVVAWHEHMAPPGTPTHPTLGAKVFQPKVEKKGVGDKRVIFHNFQPLL